MAFATRVDSGQFHAILQEQLPVLNENILRAQKQLSSGERLSVPSDDLSASQRMLRLERQKSTHTQHQGNIRILRDHLSITERYLDGLTRNLLLVQDQLLTAADSGYSTDDLRSLASPLRSLCDSLFYDCNSRSLDGSYLFSGTAYTNEAIKYDKTAAVGARYTFNGNTETRSVVVGDGINQSANVTIQEMAVLLNRLDKAVSTLEDQTADLTDPAVGDLMRSVYTDAKSTQRTLDGKIAQLGGQQNVLQLLDDGHSKFMLTVDTTYLSLGKVDYAKVNQELDGFKGAVEASYKAYSKVNQLGSLFDLL